MQGVRLLVSKIAKLSLQNKILVGLFVITLATAPTMAFHTAYRQALLSNDPGSSADSHTHNPLGLPPNQLKGLEKSLTSRCKSLYKVNVKAHSRSKELGELCSHGPDTAASLSVNKTAISSNSAVPCYGDGVSGKRIQAIYAVSSDKPDRYDQLLPSMRAWAGHADNLIDKSGLKTGSNLHAKWVTSPDCQLDVAKVVMAPVDDDWFGNTVASVREAGFADSTRKYLIWTDANFYCGIASMKLDDRKDPSLNDNNYGPSYARVDNGCWGTGDSVELHELFHNLGAVQPTTPNGSAYGHCGDEYDLMCYQDGSVTDMRYVCPQDHDVLADCNNDDYLHSKPPAGTFLEAHWNLYDSGFLYSKVSTNTVAPTNPTNLSGRYDSGKVYLKWDASKDDEGKEVTYRIYRMKAGTAVHYGNSATTTFTDVLPVAKANNEYFIVAYDDLGNASGRSNTVSVYVEEASSDPKDTTPPNPPSSIMAYDITHNGFKINWKLISINGLHRLDVILNGKIVASYNEPVYSYSFCCNLSPSTVYEAKVKVSDLAGNHTYSNTVKIKTYAEPTTQPEPTPEPEPEPTPPPSQGYKPYGLAVKLIDGGEVQISATIDRTDGDAYSHLLVRNHNGLISSGGAQHYLPNYSTSRSHTFYDRGVRPQNTDSYYIIVKDINNVEIARSDTLSFSYTGTPETNPPATPSSFTQHPTYIEWQHAGDDSGKVYMYHRTITNKWGNTSSAGSGHSPTVSTNGYSITSGETYTLRVRAEDIWGNMSAEGSYTFTKQ